MPHRTQKWITLIDSAKSKPELLEVMREYCATVLPSDIANLRPLVSKCEVRQVDEIPSLAVEYMAAELKGEVVDEEGKALMSEIALVFRAGAEKLKRLRQR